MALMDRAEWCHFQGIARRFVVALLFLATHHLPAHADVGARLQDLLMRDAVQIFGVAYTPEPLREAYAGRGYAPVFVDETGPVKRAMELIRVLSESSGDGLVPQDYLGNLPENWMHADPAEIEFALSDAFRRYGRDISGGRTTAAISEPDIVIGRKTFDLGFWLERAAIVGPEAIVAELRPRHPQYDRLRHMLLGYRALAARGGWPVISAGATLKPDMVDPRVAELRANMSARGYNNLNDTPDATVYDAAVARAVSHFQERNGLENDAVVGPQSLAALNMPAEERVNQIVVNMERWRWLAPDLGGRHILVNQANFKLQLVENGKIVDERRVIVGKAFHKSPMFSDKIRYLEFNPTWTVPHSIAGNEMLPKLRRDPGYLERNDYRIYTSWEADAPAMSAHSVNWSNVTSSRFPFKIVQQPGTLNALGRVKFMFPNAFDVYLHDTPSRGLFARADRALSHGCIRVQDPIDFAEMLLKADRGIGPAEINAILESKQTTRVDLKTPLAVHLTYFTVWVSDEGVPAFYNDVYERDALVARVFFGSV